MPAPMTDMQRAFALEYASNGGNATAAARSAGYTEKNAHELGRQLMQKAHVREAIYAELLKLRSRSGAVGLNALVSIAENPKSPASARVSAARALLDHAGLLASDNRADPEDQAPGSKIIDYQSVLRGIADARKQAFEGSA